MHHQAAGYSCETAEAEAHRSNAQPQHIQPGVLHYVKNTRTNFIHKDELTMMNDRTAGQMHAAQAVIKTQSNIQS